jgi:hypothetical protein
VENVIISAKMTNNIILLCHYNTVECVILTHISAMEIIGRGKFPQKDKIFRKFPQKTRILTNFQEFSLKLLTIRRRWGYNVI